MKFCINSGCASTGSSINQSPSRNLRLNPFNPPPSPIIPVSISQSLAIACCGLRTTRGRTIPPAVQQLDPSAVVAGCWARHLGNAHWLVPQRFQLGLSSRQRHTFSCPTVPPPSIRRFITLAVVPYRHSVLPVQCTRVFSYWEA